MNILKLLGFFIVFIFLGNIALADKCPKFDMEFVRKSFILSLKRAKAEIMELGKERPEIHIINFQGKEWYMEAQFHKQLKDMKINEIEFKREEVGSGRGQCYYTAIYIPKLRSRDAGRRVDFIIEYNIEK